MKLNLKDSRKSSTRKESNFNSLRSKRKMKLTQMPQWNSCSLS